MASDLEIVLHESTKAYRDVLDELAALNRLSLASSAESISASTDTLKASLEKAYQTHLVVNQALTGSTEETTGPLREWKDLVMRVDEENRLLSGRFRGIMSVIADELSRIKGGRVAMKGYKPSRDTKGGRLKSTF
jgi:hypothetical protein